MTKRSRPQEVVTPVLFALPALFFVIVFVAWPTLQTLILSTQDWAGTGDKVFVGLANYTKMFTRDLFFNTALQNSLLFSVCVTAGTVIVGFILAVILDAEIRMWRVYRILFFLSVTLPQVAVALLWVKIFDPFGLVNGLLDVMGLDAWQLTWMGSRPTAMAVIIFVSIWQYSGVPMIFFLAGLQGIPAELHEAAELDGASFMHRIFTITIPMLRNVFGIVITLQLIFTLKVFDVVWIMTAGGPAGSTSVLGTKLFEDAFRSRQYGYSSITATLLFIISVVLSAVYIWLMSDRKARAVK